MNYIPFDLKRALEGEEVITSYNLYVTDIREIDSQSVEGKIDGTKYFFTKSVLYMKYPAKPIKPINDREFKKILIKTIEDFIQEAQNAISSIYDFNNNLIDVLNIESFLEYLKNEIG